MISQAQTISDYFQSIEEPKRSTLEQVFHAISERIPEGFEAVMNYGMIGWVVPKSRYPAGYHCTPELPLPFGGLAAQKNGIHVYHMAMYADSTILNWFTSEYPKYCTTKLDMGKSCIRFKKLDTIPLPLLGELFSQITVDDWIQMYESKLKKK